MQVDIYEVRRCHETNKWLYSDPKHIVSGVKRSDVKEMFDLSKYIHIKPPYFNLFMKIVKERLNDIDIKCVLLSSKQLFIVVDHNDDIASKLSDLVN